LEWKENNGVPGAGFHTHSLFGNDDDFARFSIDLHQRAEGHGEHLIRKE
jgi:hypothetical protein